MCTVVEATDTTLGRKVAIKFVRRVGNENSEERLRREARAVARLRSEHIVAVFETGFTEAEGLFLVMERLEGFDIRKQLRESGPLRLPEAVHCILQVCEALAHAHAAKIVHRDIKPSNMFVTLEASGRRIVKLLDFGIALNRGTHQASNLTRDDLLGSPSFMSPEQVRAPTSVDQRSDIWSLGVSLFQMLSGELPFTGDNLGVVAMRVCDAAAPSLASLNVTVPAPVEACIQRCLRKSPANRYQSVLEVAQALVPFGDKEACRGLLSRIEHVVLGGAGGVAVRAPRPTARASSRPPPSDSTLRNAPSSDSAHPPLAFAPTLPDVDNLSEASAPSVERTLRDPPEVERLRATGASPIVESTVPIPGAQERAAIAAASALGGRERTKPIPLVNGNLTSSQSNQAPIFDQYADDVPHARDEYPASAAKERKGIVHSLVGLALALVVLALLVGFFARYV